MQTTPVHVRDVADYLRSLAPLELAEEWDNVGLLVGDAGGTVERAMTCLTLTPDVAAEAVRDRAQLVVTHHPLLFKAAKRLTTETLEGRTLLSLIAAGVNVYSAHTAFDSTTEGINAQLADLLGLQDVRPLRPAPNEVAHGRPSGSGRYGRLPGSLSLLEFLALVKRKLQVHHLQYVDADRQHVQTVGVACGSAAEFIPDALRAGCDVLLTGEARFHACLEARESGLALVLPGHYATERPGVEELARTLERQFPQLTVWASRAETDPVGWSVT
jgi:dinuclear metal center YbgI/SA1388 family protein